MSFEGETNSTDKTTIASTPNISDIIIGGLMQSGLNSGAFNNFLTGINLKDVTGNEEAKKKVSELLKND